MREEFKSYFDQLWLMKPHGKYDVVNTATYAAMAKGSKDALGATEMGKALRAHFTPSGLVNSDSTSPVNLYNRTAIVCLNELRNQQVRKALPHFNAKVKFTMDRSCRHPRDLVFFMWTQGGPILSALGLAMLWITSIFMVYSFLVSRHKTIDCKGNMAMDGEILAWLRMNTFNMPITKLLCDRIVWRKFGGYKEYFLAYYNNLFSPTKDPRHPSIVLAYENGV